MKTQINEITVNGITYVEKSTATSLAAINTKDAVIVRGKSFGVFFGYLKTPPNANGTCTLINARRLWAWDGAASISQIAVSGVSKPGNCRFPTAVPEVTLFEVIEVIPCTDTAIASINAVPVWKY